MITTSPAVALTPTAGETAPHAWNSRLPRGLRKEVDEMTWDAFLDEYAPTAGPLRLGQWTCTDTERPAGRLGPQARNFQATLALGDRIATATAAACGPIAALTAMLHDQGIAVELVAFHQIPAGSHTATFIRGSDGTHTEWAMGWSQDPTQSALRAVIACANRLLAA
ncbi:2-isopropylmalate synthase [Mycolicibacterium doricum]|uniref:Homocitrate synthase n=2 Tax=Mycolicibacterium doricum TaxID=126673 RepID=A0A1X1TG56_9MYCO|nr:homocitrate synthase [Mycolicibacterium doricum]MCV7266832.1 homocitrate synthase [Mycolicibacterium doricum]ORV43500.1 homocitrate synthase [Mycolicibacterium doricum]